jgi:hypothetical protein
VPTAPISTFEFAGVVKDDRRFHGLPLRFSFTPHPVVGMPGPVLRQYIEGKDPATDRPVIEEVIDALTKPVNGEENASDFVEVSHTGSRQVLLEPDTEDNLQRLFFERGWTDGLPIVLPTEERVARMLTGTSHARDEVVGEVFLFDTKEHVKFTVEMVAIIAVMAGARPEHLPVILATASTTHPSIQPSTTPFCCMLLVNGPIRKEIGMNSGIGAFSPRNLANSVIGRAWTLLTINWGYTRLKKTFWSSQGNNFAYNNMCCAENEERSVWEPFHVQKGFRPDESVVSVFRGWSLLNNGGGAARRSHGEEMILQMKALPALFSAATLILDPLVARSLKENEGFLTKLDYSRWLSDNVKIPVGQFWKTDLIDMLMAPLAQQGVEPYATWKRLPDDALIAPYNKPEQINIIVIGGETSPLWKTADFAHTVSAPIDKWRARTVAEGCSDGTCGLPDDDTVGHN